MTVELRDRGPSPNVAPPINARGLAVTARGLMKRFGSHRVLSDLDLHVPAGQFLAIVGRSGSGKSTLLRLLAGLDRATGGGFWFDDASHDAGRKSVRMMFQEPRLLPWATVLANVEVGLVSEIRATAGAERALEALRAVGLEDRAEAWPTILSGGQRQRVALARALVSQPRVLALDEPLGALDALTRIEMQALVEQVWLAQGFTAILVTHDVTEALVLADRVVLIEDGRVALDVEIALPRPRPRGDARLIVLQDQILGRLVANGGTAHAIAARNNGSAVAG